MPPIIHKSDLKQWQNWHQTYSQKLELLVDVWNANASQSTTEGYSDTTRGLQGLIAQALREGLEIRALGAGWSFSTAPATSGLLVNTKPLNYLFPTPRTHPSYAGSRDNLLFVQCGNSVAELNHFLEEKMGKALPTSGASNGQTIAGAIATGTHGSSLDFGAMQDFVAGLHLVVSPERHVWLERASSPTISDDIPQKMGAELIRDDALFNAALVSLGSFGIVHGVLLVAEDRYYLQAYRQRMPLTDGLWRAMDQLDFSGVQLPGSTGQKPYHLQFVINPHELERGVYVTAMYKHAQCPPGSRPPSPGSKLTPGDSALEIVGVLTDMVSDLTIPVLGRLLDRFYGEYSDICGTPGQMFTDTSTRGKAFGSALGIPLGQVRKTVETALAINREYAFPGLLALRYVMSSKATLAFTDRAPMTCVLDIDGAGSARTKTYCQKVWQQLTEQQVPYTLHWGKINHLDGARVRSMYGPERVAAWLKARQALLTSPALRAAFSNDYLRTLGLA
ncbi:FAD-binding protein [Corallococcus llansteffanensis]|uniref:FAD-binding protein n=1 Tax=Corallococcus llansteffanensis TaxID=2316731 RepID=A0A3A8QAQ5_9BACT|nr:FAD-binding protein [Corallococcus llansteffanensis]RKH65686.1 FAD-binding protein [Corallococcus llansteffanensis]